MWRYYEIIFFSVFFFFNTGRIKNLLLNRDGVIFLTEFMKMYVIKTFTGHIKCLKMEMKTDLILTGMK